MFDDRLLRAQGLEFSAILPDGHEVKYLSKETAMAYKANRGAEICAPAQGPYLPKCFKPAPAGKGLSPAVAFSTHRLFHALAAKGMGSASLDLDFLTGPERELFLSLERGEIASDPAQFIRQYEEVSA